MREMWTEDATSTKRGATEIRSAKVKDCNALGAEFEGPIATTNHCSERGIEVRKNHMAVFG